MLHQERDLFEEHRHALLRLAQRQKYVDRETNAQMKHINDVLSRRLIPLSSTSIEVGMMCTAPFIFLSPRTTTPNNNNNNR
ncbi:unnamed protein product [Rotaria sp. Silwood2]|nr:unnamed protein product [Rotaria sp. Silwood2]